MTRNYDELSKLRAMDLWDSGKINEIEVGTIKGLQQIHHSLFHAIPEFNVGEIRTVNISKDNFMFAAALYLKEALKVIEQLPQRTFDEIIKKYVEMNIAHPFIEGNGRATRIWLDLILKQELNQCVDWSKVDKQEYLDFMRLSVTNDKYIKVLLREALTPEIDSCEVFMKGIDRSYEYESSAARSIFELSKERDGEQS